MNVTGHSRTIGNIMTISIRSAALVLFLSMPLHTALGAETPAVGEDSSDPVIVTIDRARVFRISRPAATVIIGNPSIADATVEDEQTLVLTGRSFGVTNLIILDIEGNPIVDQTLVVRGHETNTVRIYRRSQRETLACAPVCEPTLTIGDNSDSFAFANSQIRARNELSDGASN